MATIRLKKGRKTWTALFFDNHGNRVEKSTGKTNEVDALSVARELEAVARGAAGAGKLRDRLQDLARQAGAGSAVPTVREWAVAWHRTRSLSVTAGTRDFYWKACADFLSFLGKAADRAIDSVQPEDVERWRDGIASRKSTRTANHRHKIMRMVFRSARLRGWIVRDPAEAVAVLRRPNRASPRRAFTVEEIGQVLAACPSPEWRSMVQAGAYTGQRLKDIALMRWADVTGGIWKMVAGKTGRVMRIPLARPVLDAMAPLERHGVFVHPEAARAVEGNHGRSGTLARRFAEILVSAGMRGKKKHRKTGDGRDGRRDGNSLCFHSLRHTCVTWMAEAGVPRAVAMEVAGHSCEAVHSVYTHVGDDAMAAAIRKLEERTA